MFRLYGGNFQLKPWPGFPPVQLTYQYIIISGSLAGIIYINLYYYCHVSGWPHFLAWPVQHIAIYNICLLIPGRLLAFPGMVWPCYLARSCTIESMTRISHVQELQATQASRPEFPAGWCLAGLVPGGVWWCGWVVVSVF